MADLAEARRFYAEELKYVAGIETPALVEAFATVPREAFLGPGPWSVNGEARFRPRTTPDDDPRHVYHNVVVSIDPSLNLNNGAPSLWAVLLDEVSPGAGERVFHLGAGTGYYTAILAELVGKEGAVFAVELRPELAPRAAASLEAWPWVELSCADGTTLDPGPCDVIVVNAGATHALPVWLERLEPGGRLLLPLTTGGFPAGGVGAVLRIERQAAELSARFVSRVGIYPCEGARDPEREALLERAMAERALQTFAVQSLRLDEHDVEKSCWLHSPGFCLSMRSLRSEPREPRSGR